MTLAIGNTKKTRCCRGVGTPPTESSEAEGESIRGEDVGSEVLAFSIPYTPPTIGVRFPFAALVAVKQH